MGELIANRWPPNIKYLVPQNWTFLHNSSKNAISYHFCAQETSFHLLISLYNLLSITCFCNVDVYVSFFKTLS